MKIQFLILAMSHLLSFAAYAGGPDIVRADGMRLQKYCETFPNQGERVTVTTYMQPGDWKEETTVVAGENTYVRNDYTNEYTCENLLQVARGGKGISTDPETAIKGLQSAYYDVEQVFFDAIEKDGTKTKKYGLVYCYKYFWTR